MTNKTVVGWTLLALFLFAALFHALSLQWPGLSVSESAETHLLFVFTNLWFANEVGRQTSWTGEQTGRFYALLVLLTLHQLIVHGYGLVLNIMTRHVEPQHLIVLVSLIVIWVLVRVP